MQIFDIFVLEKKKKFFFFSGTTNQLSKLLTIIFLLNTYLLQLLNEAWDG